MADETLGTPFTKEAMLAELEKLPEPQRIALRTSAPVPRGPAATPEFGSEPSQLESKLSDSKWLAGFESDMIDLAAAKEPKKVDKAPSKPPLPPSFPSGSRVPETEPQTRIGDLPMPVAPIDTKVKPNAPPTAAKPAEGMRPLDVPGYPTRIMVPETIAMVAAIAGWMMYAVQWMPSKLQTWEMFALVPGTLALFQFIRCAFRLASGGYALTPKQIVRTEPKPFRSPEPIDLATIAGVAVEQSPLEWMMFAGKLRLTFERDQGGDVVLGPVSLPNRRAQMIQDAIEAARQGSVIGLRAKIG